MARLAAQQGNAKWTPLRILAAQTHFEVAAQTSQTNHNVNDNKGANEAFSNPRVFYVQHFGHILFFFLVSVLYLCLYSGGRQQCIEVCAVRMRGEKRECSIGLAE